jgi:hypothetical protein
MEDAAYIATIAFGLILRSDFAIVLCEDLDELSEALCKIGVA